MNTPFDGKTWTLDHKTSDEDDHDHDHIHPASIFKHVPLMEGAKFRINIKDDDNVEIVFTDNISEGYKTIWYQAEHVYYDRPFHAVRGQLNFNTENGAATANFGAHFLLCYQGRRLLKGAGKRLNVELFSDESAIAIPTAKLIANRGSVAQPPLPPKDLNTIEAAHHHNQGASSATFNFLTQQLSHNGSWKADD